MWAAYRKKTPPENRVSTREFQVGMLAAVSRYRHAWVIEAPRKKDPHTPVGLVLATGNGYLVFPEFEWLPWASDRNKLEGMVAFLSKVRKDHKAVIDAHESEKSFMEHMCRYGIARRIGTKFDHFGRGVTAAAYETRSKASD